MAEQRSVYRYEVPVDGLPYTITLSGDLLAVAGFRRASAYGVEFWAEENPAAPEAHRVFQVYGTGDAIPSDAVWRGTTARYADGLVWHLFELPEVSR